MSSIRHKLLGRLGECSSSEVALAVRRCFREGLTGKEDLSYIANTVVRHLPSLGTRDLCDILSSFSKGQYRNFQFFSALVEHLERQKDIELEEAISITRSFSKMHFTHSKITAQCADVMKHHIDLLSPQNACDMLHRLTKLRHQDQDLLNKLVAKIEPGINTLDDASFANFCIGCSKAAVSTGTLSLICKELKTRAKSLGPLESLRTLLALSNFKAHADCVAIAAAIIQGLNCNRLSLLQLTVMLEAVANLGCEEIDKIASVIVRKKDCYPSIPPDLESRIKRALDSCKKPDSETQENPLPE